MSNDPFADAAQFLSGGLTAAKFPRIGFVVEGTVTGAKMAQQTVDTYAIGEKDQAAVVVSVARRSGIEAG